MMASPEVGYYDQTYSLGYPVSGVQTTGYYPHNSRMEGGHRDANGHPLCTLESCIRGEKPYVSVAADSSIPFGTTFMIPGMTMRDGLPIPFVVCDHGGRFEGCGYTRMDICTSSHRASLQDRVNCPYTIMPYSIDGKTQD